MLFNETGGNHEITAYLHYPGGESGLTLGPGYDMGYQKESAIQADLESIGIDPKTAALIAKNAHGLAGADAKAVVDEYGAKSQSPLIHLDPNQQMRLLNKYLPKYEHIVNLYIHVSLLQCEFNALVSFAVNPGGNFTTVATAINHGWVSDRLDEIMRRIGNKENLKKGLTLRRRREVEFYLTGHYTY